MQRAGMKYPKANEKCEGQGMKYPVRGMKNAEGRNEIPQGK